MKIRFGRPLIASTIGLAVLLSGCSNGEPARTEPEDEEPAAVPEGEPVVDIAMGEYAYAISGVLAEGGTMRIQNVGKEIHMIGVGKLRDGKTKDDVLNAFQLEGDPEAALEDLVDEAEGPMGGTYLPGKAVEVTVPEFQQGEYVFICFIPSVGDARPHAAKGMVADFTVGRGDVQQPAPDATYRLTAGRPIEGPATLAAGRRVIALEGTEGSGNLEPSLMKFAPGRSFGDVDPAFGQIFGEAPPQPDYLANFPLASAFFLHDLTDVRRMFVAVDLEPGDYLMTAHDSDTEEPVTDPVEKIAIKVT